LLTLGSLSDYVGRRPVILAALLLNAAAMTLFAHAHSASMLMAARAVQGFATSAATTALGAEILDTDRARGSTRAPPRR
jgi:MFS family permease